MKQKNCFKTNEHRKYTLLSCDYTDLYPRLVSYILVESYCCKEVFTPYRVFHDRLIVVNVVLLLTKKQSPIPCEYTIASGPFSSGDTLYFVQRVTIIKYGMGIFLENSS